MSPHATTHLAPYTCFACRGTFKRPHDPAVLHRKCPNCGGPALQMDVRFKPPRKADDRQWAKVRFLVDHGFIFQKVYRRGNTGGLPERYPDTLDQAKEFVLEFGEQALPVRVP